MAIAFPQLIVDSSEPGTVSVILQVPGYILMTIGEVLVSITGIEFAYVVGAGAAGARHRDGRGHSHVCACTGACGRGHGAATLRRRRP